MLAVVSTHEGTLTRASARDIRAALRGAGFTDLAPLITAHVSAQDVSATLAEAGIAHSAARFGDLSPQQRGGITRKRNTRAARKASRPESTGFVKAQIRARNAQA